ncbi:MAG: hypothetical protein Q7W51_03395 [Coriobacteriia bacterium]|nr:hypothetical protein [Coriobacteriia bacterium]
MSSPQDTDDGARRVEDLYRAKARAEVDAAEALVPGASVVRGQGDVLADVLLVKGEPGPGDRAKKRALAGEDGAAIGRALDALGMSPARFAVCTRVGPAKAKRIERLRLLAEAVDPRTIVLLDEHASEDFGRAFGMPTPAPGIVVSILGRDVLAVDGFEASLGDEKHKRRVWSQLKALERHGQL